MCDSLFARNNCKTQKMCNVISFMPTYTLQLKLSVIWSKKEIIIDLMSHCPYSHDLTHDFLLFPSIKNKIHDHWFRRLEEAIEAYKSHVSVTQISEQHICLKIGLLERKSTFILKVNIWKATKQFISKLKSFMYCFLKT